MSAERETYESYSETSCPHSTLWHTYYQQTIPDNYMSVHGLRASGRLIPGGDFTGDCHFFRPISGGRVAFGVFDISGRGVLASLAMLTMRGILRGTLDSLSAEETPAHVFTKLSRSLESEFGQEQFVTIWIGFYTESTGELVYASAGHPPAVHIRNGDRPEYLEVETQFPLGLIDIQRMKTEVASVTLSDGDQVLVYTDGVIDCRRHEAEPLCEHRFLEQIHLYRGRETDELLDLLTDVEQPSSCSTYSSDDVSLLLVERIRED